MTAPSMPHQDDSETLGATPGIDEILGGGGSMGAMMRAFDWRATPLGPPEDWPQSLKIVVRIMLTSRYAMWMGWGPEQTFLYNDAYRPTLGIKQDRSLGQPAPVVWAEIWDVIGPRIERVLRTGEATWDEALMLFLERSGYPEETYHTFSYGPVPGDGGGIAGMLCVVTEETERVIGERRLRALRELGAALGGTNTLDEIFAAFAGLTGVLDRDLPFSLVYLFDEAGERARLVGRTGFGGDHPAAPDSLPLSGESPWPVAELLARGGPVLVENLGARFPGLPCGAWDTPPRQAVAVPIAQQGQERPAGVLIAGLNPYRPHTPDYAGFIGLVAGQIASAVANAQAYEEERRRAEALAAIDRAKTAFFSNVSHEFRTPLTLMMSPIEEVLSRPAGVIGEQDRSLLEVAHRNSLRLLRLVNALLDFSRVEAGRVQASFEPIALAEFTAELASNFRSACERAGLTLTVVCPPLAEPVWVDRDLWEKIVLNLLSNAFKYTLEGGIRVALAMEGMRVAFSVQDSGVGIPEAELPRVFERFHRIEGQQGRTHEGSGIGLALVNELVRLHGGAIAVESAEGQGSRFTVTLPLGSAHLPADRLRAERPRVSTAVGAEAFVEEALRWLPEEARGGPVAMDLADLPAADQAARVLIADDNADMREYMQRLLGNRHAVKVAGDGAAALELIRAWRPDLVLSDVMMPRLDGFGLLKAIREDGALRDLPVILVSARAGEEASVEGLSAGADDYLVKPFSARELIARVDGALALARVRREGEEHLRQLNETLEQRVLLAVAEREKAEIQLRQAQKMEAIGRLTGGVAHDFNNLLQVVSGNLQLLGKDIAGNPRAEHRLRNALSGVTRGAKLASYLLAFARRQPLEPKAVNLGRLIRALDDMLRRALGEEVEIETVVAGGLWNTLVDPTQVENALLNLAINARDAMDGRGRLTIEAGNAFLDDAYAARHEEVVAGQYVMLAVTDTGCGMAPEVMERVFEPFFTTKPEGQGTGLGLSMIYGFVKQSGGHIKLYSEVGQGTTIRLYLPRVRQEEDIAAETDSGPVTGGAETVLVVEDDPDVRATVIELLTDLGYRVLKAKDAQSALAIVESGMPIDLLFTDVVMPGPLRSPELARRARERLPNLAVLFTSGYTENAIVHGGRLDAGVELLSKPYSREALARKLQHVLRNQRQRGQPAGTHPLPEPVAPSSGLRVLLVEDDELIRLATTDMLVELGHRVVDVGDSAGALEALEGGTEGGPFDVLLTDVSLPDGSGGDLAATAVGLVKSLKVVFATGHDRVPGAERVPGAVLLRKPYNEHDLAAVLARMVG
ncbi:signal transduction histidine kinase [Azospirillum agricola]|uniref:response regulator n=1 Tax=Azospirillum agricola TaxID=1720247 RepID=UPI001F389742|nr:response regulator [Azospirillum agricola]MBP2229592.1 signal transduction histidine kinase [Azospirillum agricola]